MERFAETFWPDIDPEKPVRPRGVTHYYQPQEDGRPNLCEFNVGKYSRVSARLEEIDCVRCRVLIGH